MKRLRLIVAVICATTLASLASQYAISSDTVSLESALTQSRQNALELLQLEADLELTRANVGSADAPNDLILFGSAIWQEDRTESASAFAGSRRNSLGVETGLRKLLPKATAIETKFTQTRDFTKFPPAAPGQPNASAFQSFNPAYRDVLELSISQPLWRNWLGRELELQRKLLESQIAPAELNILLQEQMVQAEVEQYYWSLAELEAQKALTEKLIALTKKFAALMRERTKYGRADQVDVADAEASVVSQEGIHLDQVFAAQHYRRRIRMAMNPGAPMPDNVTGPAHIYLPENALSSGAMGLPIEGPKQAYDYAVANRVDLKILEAQRKPLQAQLNLAVEQNKPDINIFGGVGKAGLEGRWDRSIADTFNDGKHFLYRFGIEAEVNLQKSELGAKQEALAAQLASLDAQVQSIEAAIRQEIEFAYSGFESARLKRIQAKKAINSLESTRQAELKKFRQARSEEIVVLSYELEVVAAQADLIAAHKLARDSDARLRTALHAYPSSR